jgi:hypothetical protein
MARGEAFALLQSTQDRNLAGEGLDRLLVGEKAAPGALEGVLLHGSGLLNRHFLGGARAAIGGRKSR